MVLGKKGCALGGDGGVDDRFKAGEVQGIKEKSRPELLEELEDCLEKVDEAARENDQFHFCIVM